MPRDLSLELERTVPGPPERVFEHFAGQRLARWWGPAGFSVREIDFEPRVGGGYRIQMQPPEGEAFGLTGTFHEVAPPSRLAFSFNWEPADPDDVETVAELSFRDSGDSTQVAFKQGVFKTEDRLALHRAGWTESFDKLEALLSRESRASAPDT